MELLSNLLHVFPPFILALFSVAQGFRHLGLFESSPKLTLKRKASEILEFTDMDKLGAVGSQ